MRIIKGIVIVLLVVFLGSGAFAQTSFIDQTKKLKAKRTCPDPVYHLFLKCIHPKTHAMWEVLLTGSGTLTYEERRTADQMIGACNTLGEFFPKVEDACAERVMQEPYVPR